MQDLAERLLTVLKEKEMKLATAESCTGGLLAATITHKAGASDVFERGFITYSNEAKTAQLGVPEDMLESYGAVSAPVAEMMAKGALAHSLADLSVSITGIAGPGGGDEDKPVGLVFLGYALKNGSSGSLEYHFEGSREEIRAQSTGTALKSLLSILEDKT